MSTQEFTSGKEYTVQLDGRYPFVATYDGKIRPDQIPQDYNPPLSKDAIHKVWTHQGDPHYVTARQLKPVQ